MKIIKKYWLLLVLLGLLLLVLGHWRSGNPLWGRNPQETGQRFTVFNQSDALLFLDYRQIEKAALSHDFRKLNLSAGWINTLNQELGSFSVLDISSLSEEIIRGKRLIVIPRGVNPPAEQMPLLSRFVEQGGILLLEMPDKSWAKSWGISTRPLKLKNPRFDFIHPQLVSRDTAEALKQTPLFTDFARLEVPDGCFTAAKVNQEPVLALKTIGSGLLVALGFDFARAVLTLQQGKPKNNLALADRGGKFWGLLETQDLAADKVMNDNSCPYADLLEKFLFATADNFLPLPRLWTFPTADSLGALIVSHDGENQSGKKLLAMAQEESRLWGRSTFFLFNNPWNFNRKTNDRLERDGFDRELHWNRFSLTQGLGRQKAGLEKIMGEKTVACRIHFLNWGPAYTRPFREMQASGFRLDASYGPNRGKGYLFGSALPFNPLDSNGLPLKIYELPFLAQEDWGGADEAWLSDLVTQSANDYHQVIGLLYHPHKLVKTPAGKALWLGAFKRAREGYHWITDYKEFSDFWAARKEVTVSSVFYDSTLEIEITVPSGNFALLLPEDGLFYHLEQVTGEGKVLSLTRFKSGGEKVALLNLYPGQHRLRAEYRRRSYGRN